MLLAKETNYRIYLGRKLVADETERVRKHEEVRNRQLEM